MLFRRHILAKILLTMVTWAVLLPVAELLFRMIDGYRLFSFRLVKKDIAPTRAGRAEEPRTDLRHMESVGLVPGVDPSWYDLDPPLVPRKPLSSTEQARLNRYPNDPIGAFCIWNPNYLKRELCAGNSNGSLGILSDFYVFDPEGPSPYPSYRQPANFSIPGFITTNSFGWRGPNFSARKPSSTIRIAFVGASTTVSATPISHPELIGHWLNLWAESQHLPDRFEVINAGQTGIDSNSIAAIVRQQLIPLSPDVVIFYEGANQFAPGRRCECRQPYHLVLPPPSPIILCSRSIQRWYAA